MEKEPLAAVLTYFVGAAAVLWNAEGHW